MDAPSLAPYTAQGEGWDEGLKILSLTLLKKSGGIHCKNNECSLSFKKAEGTF